MALETSIYSKEDYVGIFMSSMWNRCKMSKKCFGKAETLNYSSKLVQCFKCKLMLLIADGMGISGGGRPTSIYIHIYIHR